MRVLHVLDHSIPLHSGYTFRTLAILEQQKLLGWDTVHLTSSKHYDCSVLEEDVDGLHFYRTMPSSGIMSKLPVLNQLSVVLGLMGRLKQVIEKERPDIIHAHSPCLNGIAAYHVAKRFGIPLVYEMRASWEDAAVNHGSTTEGSLRYRFSRALETYALKRADAITTICEGLRNDILSRGIAADKVTVIPNAVDVERFQIGGVADTELCESLGLTGKTVIGFIGSFYDYEGLDLLLKALPEILTQYPDTVILLVGGGLQEEALGNLASSLGISDKVVFAGRVPHDQVDQYYNLISVLVYARHSVRLTEMVTPLKPLEAMAQRRLFVASDIGGHRELIEDNVTGTLFKAGSKEALARAVCGLLDASDQWDERLNAGRQYVETERNWRVSVSKYIPVYERLTGHALLQSS